MRLALVSLLAFAGLAPLAAAQTPAQTAPDAAAAPPAAPMAAPAPEATPAAPPAPAPPAPAPPAPAPPAPAPPAPAPPAPAPPAPAPPAAAPPAPATPAPAPGPEATPAAPPAAEAPPAPPPPPAAPTDPAAIAVLSVLENVCIPAANGGDLAKLAKANGYRKSGDNYVYRQAGFQFTILAPGSNPTQCHVDLVHPVYPQAPAAPLTVALHNWAAVSHGWTLYRNDKNVDGGQEFTTRSWEHSADGKNEALVLTTIRKADGTPMRGNTDTSMMIYSVTKG
jgi:hypothetical protein